MGIVTWLPNADGDWDTAANWSGGVLPTSADTVVISTTTVHTVTHSQGNDFAGSLSVGNDLFSVTGGTLTVIGAVAMADGLSVGGGTFSVGSSATIMGTFKQTGGTFLVAGTLAVTGQAQLQGGYMGANSILQATGPIVMGGSYTLGGGAQIQNTTVIYQTGNITIGDSSGVGATIATVAGASYYFASAVNINRGAATAQITNAGTLAALAGTGGSAIGVSVTSTGVVTAGVGSTLAFQGPITTLSGTITGAGVVTIAGGLATIASGTTVNVGTFSVYNNGTSLTLGGNLSIAGLYAQSGASTLSLAGDTLTLGSAAFQQNNGTPLVSGNGTLITQGATSIGGTNTGLVLGSTAVWQNFGIVTDYQSFQIGSSAAGTATFINEAAHELDLAAGVSVSNGSTPTSLLTNNGTLAMIANGGTAHIGVDVTSKGVISAAAGDNLEFDGPANSIGGTLAGGGTISFADAGTTTILAKTKISVGTLALYTRGTNLTIAANVTDAGVYSQTDGTTLSLNAATFTITGSAQFQATSNGSPDVTGTGALATTGTTTLVAGGTPLVIGGNATWMNSGTIVQQGYLQVGDSSSSTASVINATKGLFLINANNIHIANGSSFASFSNAGKLEMATNAGTSYDDVHTTSTGVVLASQGTNLIFDAASDSFAGTLTGAGQISFAAGSDTIAAGTELSAALLALYSNGTTLALLGAETISSGLYIANNSTLSIGGSTTISGFLSEQGNSFISLGANVLTLAGAAQFQQNSYSPDVTGSGTLATQGTTSLVGNGTSLVIGGSVTWSNTGAVFDTAQYVQIGDSSGLTAQLVNASGGVFELLSNGSVINNGSTPTSSLHNAGTLEMAANGGTGYVRTITSSTGTVLVLSGDNLEFDGPATTLGGTITGAGQVSFGSGSSTLAAGVLMNVATLAEYDNGTNLSLAGNVTDSGAYYQGGGATLTLAGYTLTVMGNVQFQQNSQSPVVNGPGTLVTDGVTSLTGNNPALVIGGTAAWDNNGTVLDYQSFTIGNSSAVAASVVNEAGAIFDLVASIGINNGSTPVSSFTNAGLLEMTSFGGSSSMNEILSNTGTVLAQGGRMSFLGAVSGNGLLEISAGGALAFSSTVSSMETLSFLDATGSLSLTLPSPNAFAAEISGFTVGDTIDLTSISYTNTTASFAKGVLTFTDNTTHAVDATLHFLNSPNFTFTNDGHGGVLIGSQ